MRTHCSVDAVHFLAPLRVGAVAIIAAMVNRTFASSMEVRPTARPRTSKRSPLLLLVLPPVLLPHLLRPSFARSADKPAKDIWVVVQVGVRVEEEDMRTGARTHCCSAYLTFVAVAARTAGIWGR